MRRNSLAEMYFSASKPFTSAAIFVSKLEGSKRVMVVTPERPSTTEHHELATSFPTGDTAPIPVITTLRRSFPIFASECEFLFYTPQSLLLMPLIDSNYKAFHNYECALRWRRQIRPAADVRIW